MRGKSYQMRRAKNDFRITFRVFQVPFLSLSYNMMDEEDWEKIMHHEQAWKLPSRSGIVALRLVLKLLVCRLTHGCGEETSLLQRYSLKDHV